MLLKDLLLIWTNLCRRGGVGTLPTRRKVSQTQGYDGTFWSKKVLFRLRLFSKFSADQIVQAEFTGSKNQDAKAHDKKVEREQSRAADIAVVIDKGSGEGDQDIQECRRSGKQTEHQQNPPEKFRQHRYPSEKDGKRKTHGGGILNEPLLRTPNAVFGEEFFKDGAQRQPDEETKNKKADTSAA